ncbi:hypothetical protein [Microbispora rosea]|uniref:hypothetical protein n=1 Tax=Microbispora rosea TaxID=58117 RepID=UPI0037A7DD01
MADYEFDPDLIDAQRAIDAADAKVQELLYGDREALAAAREKRLQAVETLHRHEFWKDVDNRHEADMALKKSARADKAATDA